MWKHLFLIFQHSDDRIQCVENAHGSDGLVIVLAVTLDHFAECLCLKKWRPYYIKADDVSS